MIKANTDECREIKLSKRYMNDWHFEMKEMSKQTARLLDYREPSHVPTTLSSSWLHTLKLHGQETLGHPTSLL